MTDTPPEAEADLIRRVLDADQAALAELYRRYPPRLYKMIDLRLSPAVRARVNPSDVLQEAFIDLANQLDNYRKDPRLPFFIWIRRLTGLRLAKTHRTHLGTRARNAAVSYTHLTLPTKRIV